MLNLNDYIEAYTTYNYGVDAWLGGPKMEVKVQFQGPPTHCKVYNHVIDNVIQEKKLVDMFLT